MRIKVGMKSKITMIAFACLFFIVPTGCGSRNYSTTTIEFDKTGAVILNIIEPFDTTRYDFDELCAMNEKEISDYNGSSEKVTILSAQLKDGKTDIRIHYSDDDAYYDLNKTVLFYGSVASAKSAGYNLTGKVNSIDGTKELMIGEWNEMDNEKVIIVSEPVDIVTPSKILYASEGCMVTGSNAITALEGDMRYIICQ